MISTIDGSTATSKGKVSTTPPMATKDHPTDRHHEQHPTPAAAIVWTEEMHSSFLHHIEAAFVHDILCGSWPAARHAAANHRPHHHHHHHHHHQKQQHQPLMTTTSDAESRLDRYIPDSAESTRDGHEVDALPAPAAWASEVTRRSRSIRRNGCVARAKQHGRVHVRASPLAPLL